LEYARYRRPAHQDHKASGIHAPQLSPDEKWVADVYSYTNKPPEIYIQPNQPMAVAAKVTTSPAPEFNDYAWQDAPIVEIPARDGAKLPGRLYKPAGLKKAARRLSSCTDPVTCRT